MLKIKRTLYWSAALNEKPSYAATMSRIKLLRTTQLGRKTEMTNLDGARVGLINGAHDALPQIHQTFSVVTFSPLCNALYQVRCPNFQQGWTVPFFNPRHVLILDENKYNLALEGFNFLIVMYEHAKQGMFYNAIDCLKSIKLLIWGSITLPYADQSPLLFYDKNLTKKGNPLESFKSIFLSYFPMTSKVK